MKQHKNMCSDQEVEENRKCKTGEKKTFDKLAPGDSIRMSQIRNSWENLFGFFHILGISIFCQNYLTNNVI